MKFELDQLIYYQNDEGVPCSAQIFTRATVENFRENWPVTEEQKKVWMQFGPSGIFYVTCHGVVKEEDAFGSKEEFLKALSEKMG